MSNWDRKESRTSRVREFASQVDDALDYSEDISDEDENEIDFGQTQIHNFQSTSKYISPTNTHDKISTNVKPDTNVKTNINTHFDKLNQLTAKLKKITDDKEDRPVDNWDDED